MISTLQLSNYFHQQDKCQIGMHLRALSVLRSVASSTLICICHNHFRLSPHTTHSLSLSLWSSQLKTPQWDWPAIINRATERKPKCSRSKRKRFRTSCSFRYSVCVCKCFLEVNINFEAAQDKHCASGHTRNNEWRPLFEIPLCTVCSCPGPDYNTKWRRRFVAGTSGCVCTWYSRRGRGTGSTAAAMYVCSFY